VVYLALELGNMSTVDGTLLQVNTIDRAYPHSSNRQAPPNGQQGVEALDGRLLAIS